MTLPAFKPSDRVSVAASALVTLVVTLGLLAPFQNKAFAATNSSWGSEPSWANTTGNSDRPSSPARSYSTKQKYVDNSTLTPFAPGSNNVSLEMGQVFLMGTMGDRYSDSIGESVKYTYGVSDLFDFESALGYSSHSDGKMGMTSLQAGLRTNLAWYDRVIPYVSFGLGFYHPSYDVSSLTGQVGENVSSTLFGVHLGPGVDLAITKQFFFGASLTFNDVFGNSQQLSNGKAFDVGGSYTSFFLHAGMTF